MEEKANWRPIDFPEIATVSDLEVLVFTLPALAAERSRLCYRLTMGENTLKAI